jgi:hypothetical protein
MGQIEINQQFEQVLRFVNNTAQSIFLTGKAGTGKTTLLKYIKQNTYKQISIVAPTGVAAINAGGTTIHSFFQFPFTPFIPSLSEDGNLNSLKTNLPVLKYSAQRLSIFRNLELLIIDEVSMVRADLLDQIDITLRQTRKKWHLPFGGVQVMLIGDMFQLPPVVQQEEWNILSKVYTSCFFFDSLVVQNHPPVFIELTKIYRQSDQQFIGLLNKVRNNQLDRDSLDLLNSHYKANITREDYDSNITLTTHNRKADEINLRSLNALPGKEYRFKCKVEGVFAEKTFPAEETLILKKGTRVMFLKNNQEKNYYNGKIGVITYIDEKSIRIKSEEDKYEIEVQKESWTNVSYKVDKSTKAIEEEVLGTFYQYPLRLAWAITIHKSQGLTFDNLIIDAAEAFSAGQVYVALSRCRSLKGLILSSRISEKSLMNDKKISHFSSSKHSDAQVSQIYSGAHKTYLNNLLTGLFDFNEISYLRKEAGGILQMNYTRVNSEGMEWSHVFFSAIDSLFDIGNKFKNQLNTLLENSRNSDTDEGLQKRIRQGAVYFATELQKVISSLKDCGVRSESKEAATQLNEIFQQLFDLLSQKWQLIKTCENGFVFSNFIREKLKLVYPDFKINVYATGKNIKTLSGVKHPALFKKLLFLRDEICNEEMKPVMYVASQKTIMELANFLPVNKEQLIQISGFGKAKVEVYGEKFLKIIRDFVSDNNLHSSMDELPVKKIRKKKTDDKNKEELNHHVDIDSERIDSSVKKTNTKEQTFRQFREGKRLEQIAKERGLAIGTIQAHLIPYIATGELHIDFLVPRKKQLMITGVIEELNGKGSLNTIKQKLPEDVSYADIRYVLASKLVNV